jgi:hypothetical protein
MLARYGWSFERIGADAWRTGFQGEKRSHSMHISLSGTCVSFEVRPLIDVLVDCGRWPRLPRELLELNGRLKLVKVAVNEDGEVTLACQVLTASLSYDAFSRLLGIIGYYAEEVGPEILARLTAASQAPTQQLLC